ncbi:MAG: hypothetical protein BECKG1743D_GA0114223_101294 [Candidatus Kentron sp. G]|nr:MAG: hypothetical protein BECKG1743E_GA0114224_100275 [Candidatus Kentron sp. G]VFM96932.1 MAG: hypothetical protein BECKG1743F_GA0114225_102083 [Candidatus Kentron sp. G]VFM99545.1 MAG: hypothetical protein BECKG1743D_GA0114223_101294 [Candidatus Kentron sp. G]
MNQKPDTIDQPETSTEGENGLHQALSALEGLLHGAKAENIRRNRNESSGGAFGDDFPTEDEEKENFTLPDTDSEAFQALIGQLTDEIEIIVQSRVEEALRGVTKEITHQVRNHLNIMLPTFLDNFSNLAFHQDDES